MASAQWWRGGLCLSTLLCCLPEGPESDTLPRCSLLTALWARLIHGTVPPDLLALEQDAVFGLESLLVLCSQDDSPGALATLKVKPPSFQGKASVTGTPGVVLSQDPVGVAHCPMPWLPSLGRGAMARVLRGGGSCTPFILKVAVSLQLKPLP